MVPGFHGVDLIVILVIALLVFGPKKLPEMGSAVGKSIKEFKKGISELTGPKDKDKEEETTTSARSLEAIERELASKRAEMAAREAAQAEVKAEEPVSTVKVEDSAARSKVD